MINKRLETNCAPDHECSGEEIAAILKEFMLVHEDPDIIRWELPGVSQMVEINLKADEYKAAGGEGYWAEVCLLDVSCLTGDESSSFVEEYNKICDDSFGRGIFLTISFTKEISDNLFEKFD